MFSINILKIGFLNTFWQGSFDDFGNIVLNVIPGKVKEIKALNKKVIGQDEAKKRISITIYEHLRNITKAKTNSVIFFNMLLKR